MSTQRYIFETRLIQRVSYSGFEMSMIDFGRLVKERREELGYSVEELAKKIGVRRNTIYKIERAESKDIYAGNLFALCKALRWSLEEAKRAYEGKDPYKSGLGTKDKVYEAVLEFVERLPKELTD